MTSIRVSKGRRRTPGGYKRWFPDVIRVCKMAVTLTDVVSLLSGHASYIEIRKIILYKVSHCCVESTARVGLLQDLTMLRSNVDLEEISKIDSLHLYIINGWINNSGRYVSLGDTAIVLYR